MLPISNFAVCEECASPCSHLEPHWRRSRSNSGWPAIRSKPEFSALHQIAKIFVRNAEKQAVRVGDTSSGPEAVSLQFAQLLYFFGMYPCHIYSKARGSV